MSDIELIGESGRYGDVYGAPGWGSGYQQGFGGGGGGGGGFTGPFLPGGFGGGASPFGGFGAGGGWAEMIRRRRMGGMGGPAGTRTAFSGGGAQMPQFDGGGQTQAGGMVQGGGRMAAPMMGGFGGPLGGAWARARAAAPPPPQAGPGGVSSGWNPANIPPIGVTQTDPDWWRGKYGPINSPMDIFANLIRDAGGQGAFGLNPPEGVMQGVRQQAIQDAGAQQRAQRLALQGRSDIDPSTFGFQSLMSQLQGDRNVSQRIGQADLGLRQQQLQNLWGLLQPYLGAHMGALNTEVSGRWNRANQPSPWGQAIGAAGQIGAGLFGG